MLYRAADADEEIDEFEHIEKLQQLGINAGKSLTVVRSMGVVDIKHSDFVVEMQK